MKGSILLVSYYATYFLIGGVQTYEHYSLGLFGEVLKNIKSDCSLTYFCTEVVG